MITHLNKDEARAQLRRGRIGHLGCIVGGDPYVLPVNYIFEDNFIYIHSLPGRKIEAMRSNGRVCLQVDDIESQLKWTSVIALGKFEEIESPAERASILDRFFARFSGPTPVESKIAEGTQSPNIVVFRIRIDRISAIGSGDQDTITDLSFG